MKNSKKHTVSHYIDKQVALCEIETINEEPLSIVVQGKPYSVVRRTPGDEIAHAAGFCLSKGIVDSIDDFDSIESCEDGSLNVVSVTLKNPQKKQIQEILERKGFINQTSYGICGKQMVNDLFQVVKPIHKEFTIDLNKLLDSVFSLSDYQTLRKKTFSSHAAGIFSYNYNLLSIAEDVGRHNALDKAIGKLLLSKNIEQACFVILSSRISYELVQKTARANIPALFAISRPTSIAIELAQKLNMTLGCLSKQDGLYIFSQGSGSKI